MDNSNQKNSFPYTNPYSQVQQHQSSSRAVNPYKSSSQQQGLEEVLSILERSSDNVLSNLQALLNVSGPSLSWSPSHNDESSSSFAWSVGQVLRFAAWSLSTTSEHSSRSEGNEKSQSQLIVAAIFSTLASLIKSHHWEDTLVYAAVTLQDDDRPQRTLLSVLQKALLDGNSEKSASTNLGVVQCAVLMALSALWSSLDRLEPYFCQLGEMSGGPNNYNDVVWWLEQHNDDGVYDTAVVNAALQGLVLCQEDWQQLTISTIVGSAGLCEFKTACAAVQVYLLRHQHTGWLYQQQQPVKEWARKLIQESSRLNDANMPVSAYTLFSLTCLELLTVLQLYGTGSSFLDQNAVDEFKRLLQTTDILQYVIAAAVWTQAELFVENNDISGPRWTQQPSLAVQQQSLAVLNSMHHASPAAFSKALASYPSCTQLFVQKVWKLLLIQQETKQQDVSNEQLDRLLFLHKACRQITRETVLSVMNEQRKDDSVEASCGRLLPKLLDWTRQNHSTQAAALLCQLLADRLNPVFHDELSRCLGRAAAPNDHHCFAEDCMKLIVELATSNDALSDYHRPTLLCLLDLVCILLMSERNNAQTLLASLSAQTVEALVQVVSPKEVRVDVSVVANDHQHRSFIIESDEITPPVHNLSRFDTSMSCVLEEERMSRGVDPAIRMAAATLLSILGSTLIESSAEQGNRVALLRGRVLGAANAFVADMHLSFSAQQSKPADGGPASFDMARRRLRLLTSLATPDNEVYLANLIYSFDTTQLKYTSDLLRRLKRCNKTLDEYREKEKRLITENETFSVRLTAQAVAFQREKSELRRCITHNAKELVEIHSIEREKAEKRARELSKHMAEAKQTIQISREAEAQALTSLRALTAELNEVSVREQFLVKRTERSESEIIRVSDEIKAANVSLNNASAKDKELRHRLSEQREQIEDLEHSEGQIRDSLENLFGDMVSLARLYIIKEENESTVQKKYEAQIEKLTQRLEAERQRSAELEERDKRSQYEIDILLKKYAKAKEKLEKERDDRSKEADQRRKRTDPVSYINQLHSTSGSASDRSGSRKGSRVDGGKENRSKSSSLQSPHNRPKNSSRR